MYCYKNTNVHPRQVVSWLTTQVQRDYTVTEHGILHLDWKGIPWVAATAGGAATYQWWGITLCVLCREGVYGTYTWRESPSIFKYYTTLWTGLSGIFQNNYNSNIKEWKYVYKSEKLVSNLTDIYFPNLSVACVFFMIFHVKVLMMMQKQLLYFLYLF